MAFISEFNLLQNRRAEELLSIMNIFLRASESLELQLLPEQVYERMKQVNPAYYSEEDLNHDLRYLCSINNLKCQDENPFGIRTLEEYKNRKKYYSITASGIAFTRAVNEYLSYTYKQKVISSRMFQRIEEDIHKIDHVEDKDIYEWWDIFLSDCTRLFQSYQDYINQFSSDEFNKLSEKMEFLDYKNDFIISINQMISNLGDKARNISYLIEQKHSRLKSTVEKISNDKQTIPMNIISVERREMLKKETIIQWNNIEKWFLFKNGEQPTYLSILDYTSTIISQIMKKTSVLSQMEHNDKISEVLLENIGLFSNCITLEEASNLYVEKYGVQTILHIGSDHQDSDLCEDFETGSILTYPYEKLSRSRRKTMEIGFEENGIQREKKAFEILKEQKEMINHLMSFKQGDQLSLENVNELLSQKETEILLKWISGGLSGRGQTDDGLLFDMEEDEKDICLKTESGDLYIKNYILDFGVNK